MGRPSSLDRLDVRRLEILNLLEDLAQDSKRLSNLAGQHAVYLSYSSRLAVNADTESRLIRELEGIQEEIRSIGHDREVQETI